MLENDREKRLLLAMLNEIDGCLGIIQKKEVYINNLNKEEISNLQSKVNRKRVLDNELHSLKDRVQFLIS